MKKTLLILTCIAFAFAANAAKSENPADTYFKTGKNAMKTYDDLLGRLRLNMGKEEDKLTMAQKLMEGYDNLLLVLPLDTVIDAKGKVKTKYSKDVKNLIAGHYPDFMDAGAYFFNAEDYKNAIRTWDTFVELSENPGRFDITPRPDTIVADYIWNSALAAYKDNNPALAAKTMVKAAQKGYDKEVLFQYGLQIAEEAKDPESILYFATEGDKKFGTQDTRYVNGLINYYLNSENYDEALSFLDKAIERDPSVSQYYVLKGYVNQRQNNFPAALELYKKAYDMDPQNGKANYFYGSGLYAEAGKMADEFTGSQAQYDAFYNKELVPRYHQAIEILENAYKLDPDNRGIILNYLDQLYYVTNNSQGMDSVKERKLNDD